MSGTMRAIVQEGYGSPDVLHLREIDRPIVADDSVLVRVCAASVNAADCHLLHMPVPARLLMGLRKPRLGIRGFDVSGYVESVGKNVTRFKAGDEIFGTAKGSFAEYVSATEDRLATKPRRLTFGEAAAIPVAGFTALQGLRDKARLEPGQRVLIFGAGGGVGTFAVQIAIAMGAYVTAVTSTRNMDVIRSMGPDEVIDYMHEDFSKRGQRYDVFFDVAATRPLSECRSVLSPTGVFVGAGAAKGSYVGVVTRLLKALVLSRLVSQRIERFMAKACYEDLVALAQLVEDGKLTPVIDREYSLSEVPAAIRYVDAGQARAKVVINVS